MRDNDTILLESLYLSILEEDAESSKAQALNILVKKEIGYQVFKAKNNPENKDAFDSAKTKWNGTVESLAEIITKYNPKDKNLSDIVPLTNFLVAGANINLLSKEYKDYTEQASLFNQKTIHKAPDFLKWTEQIHSKMSEGRANQELHVLGTDADPNKVYDDENITVFLSNNSDDPRKSVSSCKKYGKGTNLCISGSSASHYYHSYRWEKKLTTYFIWLKKENRYILVDAVEDGGYQYNNVKENHDYSSTPKQIIKKYPDLKRAFDQGIFKSVPITGKEQEYYEKFYEENGVEHFKTLEDILMYTSFHNLTKEDWENIRQRDLVKPVLEVAVENSEDEDINLDYETLDQYPAPKKRYWDKKKQNVERELGAWDDDDEFDFTPDELKILGQIKEVPQNFIDTLLSNSTKAGMYVVTLIDNGRSLSDVPEEVYKRILTTGSPETIYDILSVLLDKKQPIDERLYQRVALYSPSFSVNIAEKLLSNNLKVPEAIHNQILQSPYASADYITFLMDKKIPITDELIGAVIENEVSAFKTALFLINNNQKIHESLIDRISSDTSNSSNFIQRAIRNSVDYYRIPQKIRDTALATAGGALEYNVLNISQELLKKADDLTLPNEVIEALAKSYTLSRDVAILMLRDVDLHNIPPKLLDTISKSARASYDFYKRANMADFIPIDAYPKYLIEPILDDDLVLDDFVVHILSKRMGAKIPEYIVDGIIKGGSSSTQAKFVYRKFIDKGEEIPDKWIKVIALHPETATKMIFKIIERDAPKNYKDMNHGKMIEKVPKELIESALSTIPTAIRFLKGLINDNIKDIPDAYFKPILKDNEIVNSIVYHMTYVHDPAMVPPKILMDQLTDTQKETIEKVATKTRNESFGRFRDFFFR